MLPSVAYEMALEQIIADLDDLEERVENLNVDQKTNEDILLNVLKRVDETEKDLRKVRCNSVSGLCAVDVRSCVFPNLRLIPWLFGRICLTKMKHCCYC